MKSAFKMDSRAEMTSGLGDHGMGIMTHLRNEFAIDFYNLHVDPNPIFRKECNPLRTCEEVVDTCIKDAARH